MPAPQSQVIYLPAKRDTTAEGAQMLMHALQQMVSSIQENRANKQYQERQAKLDAIAAEERTRTYAAEDTAKQRADEAEIARLAPETSMYEPAPPSEAPTAVPGEEDLQLPPETVDLGLKRLAAPLLNEITLPSGKKIPFNVNPSMEQSEAEAQANKANAVKEMLQTLGMKTEVEEGIKSKYREKPNHAPTIDPITGMGWNPETNKFNLDVGHSKKGSGGGVGTGSAPIPGMVGDFNLTGEEFLKTIPIQYRNDVKKIANSEVNVKDIASMRKSGKDSESERLKLFTWAGQYNPSFDPLLVPGRITARQELARGTPSSRGGVKSSLNRFARHLDTFKEASDEMEAQGLSTHDTAIQNRLGLAFTPQAKQTSTSKHEVASAGLKEEYTKLLSGGVPTDKQNEALRIVADLSQPKANREAAMQTLAHFVAAQANAQEDWYTGMFGEPSVVDGHPLMPTAAGWIWDERAGWTLPEWTPPARGKAAGAHRTTAPVSGSPASTKIKSITLVSE